MSIPPSNWGEDADETDWQQKPAWAHKPEPEVDESQGLDAGLDAIGEDAAKIRGNGIEGTRRGGARNFGGRARGMFPHCHSRIMGLTVVRSRRADQIYLIPFSQHCLQRPFGRSCQCVEQHR